MDNEQQKDPLASEFARRGGKKGGPARAKALSKSQRVEQARLAANVRWAKEKGSRSQDAIDEVIAMLRQRLSAAEAALRQAQAKVERYRRQLADAEERRRRV